MHNSNFHSLSFGRDFRMCGGDRYIWLLSMCPLNHSALQHVKRGDSSACNPCCAFVFRTRIFVGGTSPCEACLANVPTLPCEDFHSFSPQSLRGLSLFFPPSLSLFLSFFHFRFAADFVGRQFFAGKFATRATASPKNFLALPRHSPEKHSSDICRTNFLGTFMKHDVL